MPNPSEEQQEIIDHNPDQHGRVLAGPGTGKSFTAISMLQNLTRMHDDLDARMVTFTRAATQEIAQRIEEEAGLEIPPPSTIHSLALRILLRNPEVARLPTPIRISIAPEVDKIRRDIGQRLRDRGYKFDGARIDKGHVEDLEREMSSKWEALDEDKILLTDITPELRGAYSTLWDRDHRSTLGYTLLSEISYRAVQMLEDYPDVDVDAPDLLLVDEYQDLNNADIRFLEELVSRGTRILAIGDDDQSIYGFREAAPEGIRDFPDKFGTDQTYTLTQCFRCGREILRAATSLIQAAADPERSEPLVAATDYEGLYRYARFKGNRAEARGIADMVRARLDQGVSPKDIVVLVRSSVNNWIAELEPEFEERDIEWSNPDRVKTILGDEDFLRKIEILWIAAEEEGRDSLAWWMLLDIKNGISDDFREYIYQEARESNELFSDTLLRLYPDFEGSPTTRSANAARKAVKQVLSQAEEIRDAAEDPDLGELGWGGWILDRFGREEFREEEIELLEEVGSFVGGVESLRDFLGKLEPVAKDLATDDEAVRIMSITKSKGLTVDSVFVMGVEEGIIPRPDEEDVEEERRLLYVAMTRAEKLCVLSYAGWRTRGATVQLGGGDSHTPRGRSPLLEHLEIGEWRDGEEVVEEVQKLG